MTAADEIALPRTTRSVPTVRLLRLIAILSILFVALAVFVALHRQPNALDRVLDRTLLANRGSPSFELFRVITVAGSATVVAFAAGGLALSCWIRTRDARLAALCIVAIGLAGIAEVVVKQLVRRTRPPTKILTHESGFGFPSGHTTGATALAVVAVLMLCALAPRGRRRTIAVFCASAYTALVAASRVAVGAHYATDVLGGFLLGVTTAIIVMAAGSLLVRRKPAVTVTP